MLLYGLLVPSNEWIFSEIVDTTRLYIQQMWWSPVSHCLWRAHAAPHIPYSTMWCAMTNQFDGFKLRMPAVVLPCTIDSHATNAKLENCALAECGWIFVNHVCLFLVLLLLLLPHACGGRCLLSVRSQHILSHTGTCIVYRRVCRQCE